jgi:hypothetical protein
MPNEVADLKEAMKNCNMVDDGMLCLTHNCGATDDVQCATFGCPHCHAMQELIHGKEEFDAYQKAHKK